MVYSQIDYVVGVLITENELPEFGIGNDPTEYDTEELADDMKIPRPFNIYTIPHSDSSKYGWTAVIGYVQKTLYRADVSSLCSECQKEDNRWNCCKRCLGLMKDGTVVNIDQILDMEPIVSTDMDKKDILYPNTFKRLKKMFKDLGLKKKTIKCYPIPDDCTCCS